MSLKIGTDAGILRRATIRKYNEDGTVQIALNDVSLASVPQIYNVPLSAPWLGPNGEFIGGYPRTGSSVIVSQGEGGQFFILSYIPSNQVFDTTTITNDSGTMTALQPGRALMQVADGTKVLLDPKEGIKEGNDDYYYHLNSNKSIISHNFKTEMAFTEAGRHVEGIIKRDLVENTNRNILNSTLISQSYDDSLKTISLDPTLVSNPITLGGNIRNIPLVESRSIVYETANSFGFTTDEDEYNKYTDIQAGKSQPKASRRDNRTDTVSLSLEAPNQLIESISGTVVDTFGNILDLNRNVLPIGKIESLSLEKNTNKAEAFAAIRAQLRKSIAFHWELNARKGGETPVSPRDTDVTSDYARKASKFSLDIDKEGQFKLNVPASSEEGNIPLLTRYENFSVLNTKNDGNPNDFIRSETGQEIFLENFAGSPNIELVPTEVYNSAIDRITDQPIKYGTAFHDINATISEFTSNAGYLQAGVKLVNFDSNHHLNRDYVPLEKVISPSINVSGADANAGGRSGSVTFDGFTSWNYGANTIDRQSKWEDFAGSVIARYGRDNNNISYAASYDGDVFLQVGGSGLGNSFDSRFANANDAYRNGTFEIRVLNNGQLTILRMSPTGIDIVSPGIITMSAQQHLILRANGNILLEGENIVMYGETEKRIVNRQPNTSI